MSSDVLYRMIKRMKVELKLDLVKKREQHRLMEFAISLMSAPPFFNVLLQFTRKKKKKRKIQTLMKETNIRAKLLCLKENCTEVTICFFVLFLAPLLKSKYTWVCIHKCFD